MQEYVLSVLDSLIGSFTQPQKRVFIGYLLSAWCIALLWLVLKQKHTWHHAALELFRRDIWGSVSARSDYSILIINRLIAVLVTPVLLAQLTVATFLFESLHYIALPEPLWQIDISSVLVAFIFTLTLFLLDDVSRYMLHRALHQFPALWAFHRVHHSATTMTPLTVFRTHPVENILFGVRSAIVQGLCLGPFIFLFGDKVDLATVFGANIFIFVFNVLGSNLRHSHIYIRYPQAVEQWLISPAQHQIHHSVAPRHFDKNYGVVLAVWDRIGNSLYLSEENTRLQFGLDKEQSDKEHTLWSIYIQPFFIMQQVVKNGYVESFRALSVFFGIKRLCITFHLFISKLYK